MDIQEEYWARSYRRPDTTHARLRRSCPDEAAEEQTERLEVHARRCDAPVSKTLSRLLSLRLLCHVRPGSIVSVLAVLRISHLFVHESTGPMAWAFGLQP